MRWQRETVTEGSREIALISSLLRLVERDAEELDVDAVRVSPDPLEALVEGRLEFCVSGAEWLSEDSEELEGIGAEVVVRRCTGGGRRLRDLYAALPLIPPRRDGSLLKNLARRTSESGVEYIVFYSKDGRAYLLEGEEYQVIVPHIPMVGSVHTHPEDHCGLSRRDVESALYAMAELSFFEASATPSCYFYMARLGFMHVDDFAYLLNRELMEPVSLRSVLTAALLY